MGPRLMIDPDFKTVSSEAAPEDMIILLPSHEGDVFKSFHAENVTIGIRSDLGKPDKLLISIRLGVISLHHAFRSRDDAIKFAENLMTTAKDMRDRGPKEFKEVE